MQLFYILDLVAKRDKIFYHKFLNWFIIKPHKWLHRNSSSETTDEADIAVTKLQKYTYKENRKRERQVDRRSERRTEKDGTGRDQTSKTIKTQEQRINTK